MTNPNEETLRILADLTEASGLATKITSALSWDDRLESHERISLVRVTTVLELLTKALVRTAEQNMEIHDMLSKSLSKIPKN